MTHTHTQMYVNNKYEHCDTENHTADSLQAMTLAYRFLVLFSGFLATVQGCNWPSRRDWEQKNGESF